MDCHVIIKRVNRSLWSISYKTKKIGRVALCERRAIVIKDFIHYYKPYKNYSSRFYLCGDRGHSRACLSGNSKRCRDTTSFQSPKFTTNFTHWGQGYLRYMLSRQL